MGKIAIESVEKSDKIKGGCIKNNMAKENGKYKIICLRAPRWLAFLLRKFCRQKG